MLGSSTVCLVRMGLTQSKISLETLFNHWNSKSWGEYLFLASAVIGYVPTVKSCTNYSISWTCGTGVMDALNMVAHELESYRVHTFSCHLTSSVSCIHPCLVSRKSNQSGPILIVEWTTSPTLPIVPCTSD